VDKSKAAAGKSALTWRGCERLPADGGDFTYTVCPSEHGFTLAAFPAGSDTRNPSQRVGYLKITYEPLKKRYMVGLVKVVEKFQGRGLATRLYERGLALSCKPQGRHTARALSSDLVRSVFAEAFWRKQERKGRARCVPGHGVYYSTPLDQLDYALTTGRITAKEYAQRTRGLPSPPKEVATVYGERTPVWPCERYEITCASRPKSLAGYKIKADRKSRRRSR